MSRVSRARAALCVPALGLAVLTPALTSTPAVSAAAGRLTASPNVYVGGQLLTFAGHLGPKRQRIHLESMAVNRPGAEWVVVPGSGARTDAQGDFRFRHPAPSMFNKKYRVVGGGRVTEGVLMNARSQDLVLWAQGTPVAGEPFTIAVDTTPGPHEGRDSPAFVARRPDLPPPVFPGRELTLQRRDGSDWDTLATTTTNSEGRGFFDITEPAAGTPVYRVREENYPQAGGPAIGWFPSFPTPVSVLASAGAARQATAVTTTRTVAKDTGSTATMTTARATESGVSAGQRWGWNPAQFDFAWVAGESLTSRPYRGRDPRGWWRDFSTGSGRAATHNGQLTLESSRDVDGSGDFGTTGVEMQDHPMTYGRWEVRMRARSFEGNARDYVSKVELVPNSGAYCANQSITVAEVRAHSSTLRFGARSARLGRQWQGTRRVGNIDNYPLALGVEITRNHVSWFVDGRLVGSAPRAAVPDVPLTVRLTLTGSGNDEMNGTHALYDWVRGWNLDRGKPQGDGPRMAARALDGGC